MLFLGLNVEASLRRYLLPPLGDERGKVWGEITADGDNLVFCRQFEVELSLDRLCQKPGVSLPDVSTILPQVKDDAVSTGLFTATGGVNWVRKGLFACVAQRANMIDVDKKIGHNLPRNAMKELRICTDSNIMGGGFVFDDSTQRRDGGDTTFPISPR